MLENIYKVACVSRNFENKIKLVLIDRRFAYTYRDLEDLIQKGLSVYLIRSFSELEQIISNAHPHHAQ